MTTRRAVFALFTLGFRKLGRIAHLAIVYFEVSWSVHQHPSDGKTGVRPSDNNDLFDFVGVDEVYNRFEVLSF